METAAVIILAVGILAALTAVVILRKQNRDYRKKCIKAAQRIIREEYLDGSIMKKDETKKLSRPRKTMVVLRIKGSREKGFVFDPEQEIRIGRSLESSDLCLQDPSVSSHNSRIFLYQGQLCIQDMDSANGTAVWSRGRGKQTLWGETGFLYDRSRIWVGNTCILIRVFRCSVNEE